MEGKDRDDDISKLARRLQQMGVRGARGQQGQTGASQATQPQGGEQGEEEEEAIPSIDMDYFQRMRADIERENRAGQSSQGSGKIHKSLFRKNTKAVQDLNRERSRQSSQALNRAFFGKGYTWTDTKRMMRNQPAQVRQRTPPLLLPKRRRTLDQIRRDMLRRRRQPQQRRQYRGSPSVRMSQKLVDRSRHILRYRRRDPEREERIRRIVKQKTDWKGLDDRKTYRPSSPFQQREINQLEAKALMKYRRQQVLAGQKQYEAPESVFRPTNPKIPKDIPFVEEMYEPQDPGPQFFPQQFTGYQNPFQPGPSGQGSGRSGQSSTTETSPDMEYTDSDSNPEDSELMFDMDLEEDEQSDPSS